MHTTTIGNHGEQLVSEELLRLGYRLIERNWKTKWAEVDIVVEKDGVLHFVEVKLRGSGLQGDGFDYITDKKLWHMQRAAELWVSVHNWNGEYVLLAAAVDGQNNQVDIREI